jgi:hypothetical protein
MTEDTQRQTQSESQITEVSQLVKEKLSDDNGKLECEINEDQADYKLHLTEEELHDLSFALRLALSRVHKEGDGETESAENMLNINNRIAYTELEET